MNPEELKQNIALFYSKLPPNVQVIFASMSWLETLKKISAKYALNDQQIETLGTETTLVLLGIIPIEEYTATVKKEISLSDAYSLEAMLSEINSLVLGPIKSELNNAFNANLKLGTNTEQALDARFENLSPGRKEAITKSNYQEVLYAISQENKLNVDQAGILETTTMDMILGIAPSNKFEDTLKSNLKIDAEKASKIVNEVTDKILRKIRENMMTPQSEKPVAPPPAEQEQKHEQEQQQEQAKTNPPAEPILVVPNAPMPPKIIHPILEQKLAGSFQMPKTETEYSLNNLSQNSQTKSAEPTPPDSTPKIDPYREIPE